MQNNPAGVGVGAPVMPLVQPCLLNRLAIIHRITIWC